MSDPVTSQLKVYGALVAVALLIGSHLYAAKVGGDIEEAKWVKKVASLQNEQQAKLDAETKRQAEENAKAKLAEAETIRQLEATINGLHVLLMVSAEEAKADPEASKQSLSKGAAVRLGKIK